MKTTNNKALLAAVAVSAFALIALTKMAAASIVPMLAIGSSYVAVAILVALAASDYRVGTKNYSAR